MKNSSSQNQVINLSNKDLKSKLKLFINSNGSTGATL